MFDEHERSVYISKMIESQKVWLNYSTMSTTAQMFLHSCLTVNPCHVLSVPLNSDKNNMHDEFC